MYGAASDRFASRSLGAFLYQVRERLASGVYRIAVSGNSTPRRLVQRLLQSRSDWD